MARRDLFGDLHVECQLCGVLFVGDLFLVLVDGLWALVDRTCFDAWVADLYSPEPSIDWRAADLWGGPLLASFNG